MPGQPVSILDPKYYSRSRLGRIFSAMTAVTGVAPGTALGTTAAFTLQNKVGSGVNLVLLESRMGARKGHFMPTSLLDSQLKTLENPTGEPGVLTVDIDATIGEIIQRATAALNAG